jgi:lipoate-protein ligase B
MKNSIATNIDTLVSDYPESRWLCVEPPLIGYREAWDLQSDLVGAIKDKVIHTNVVLMLEHSPVFTLGRRGGLNNLRVSKDFLAEQGIAVIQVERGGDITYHGLGQLVVYPIMDLRVTRLGVAGYVEHLEELMIRTAADWGITAERNPKNNGVWVGNSKLGSIGIAIRKGISFHGMALNVNVSLEPFSWISPCGLQDTEMTSMERELSRSVSMNQVRQRVQRNVEQVFGVELVTTSLSELQAVLKN